MYALPEGAYVCVNSLILHIYSFSHTVSHAYTLIYHLHKISHILIYHTHIHTYTHTLNFTYILSCIHSHNQCLSHTATQTLLSLTISHTYTYITQHNCLTLRHTLIYSETLIHTQSLCVYIFTASHSDLHPYILQTPGLRSRSSWSG